MMTNVDPVTASECGEKHSRLAHFPVSFFAMVMGTTGLALAWKRAVLVLGAPAPVWQILTLLASGLFVLLALVYLNKLQCHWHAVREEWHHPIRKHFFPAISISFLLLAAAWVDLSHQAGQMLWIAGTVLQLAFTLGVVSSWIFHEHYQVQHTNPAWFIPAVGNIIVPVAGIHFAPAELLWFFFSIGIVFWLILLTIVLYRLFFHEPLPPRLRPTLFILLAPPAIGFIAYTGMTGALDNFGQVLYSMALFLTLVLAVNIRRFLGLPFFISGWAYSFPLASVTIATLVMAARTNLAVYTWLGTALLVITSLLIAFLFFKTSQAVRNQAICVPE